MLFFYILKIFASKIGPLPKIIELPNRKDSYITGFSNGVLLIQRSEEPTRIIDPSIVHFIEEDNDEYRDDDK